VKRITTKKCAGCVLMIGRYDGTNHCLHPDGLPDDLYESDVTKHVNQGTMHQDCPLLQNTLVIMADDKDFCG